MVPLIKSLSAADDEPYGTQVVGGPTEDLYIPGHEWREFRLKCKRPPRDTHEVWIRRTERLVPTVTRFRRGHPTWIRLTNILAYAESRDETLFERERELYECWLAEQPPAVERREYPTPRDILTRDAEDSGPVDEFQVYCAEDMTLTTDTTGRECGRRDGSLAFRAVADALCTESSCGVPSENIGASDQIAAGVVSGRDAEENDVSEHLANDIELTDYAQELAFLPDLTEIMVTALDYTGPNVQSKDLDAGQQRKLVDVLKHHEKIMISSGNALPPPAY
ncbi:Hypothetical protein PHPALM_11254, partial [Phytophthora palmivora]